MAGWVQPGLLQGQLSLHAGCGPAGELCEKSPGLCGVTSNYLTITQLVNFVMLWA